MASDTPRLKMRLQARIATCTLFMILCSAVGVAQERKFWPRDPYDVYELDMYERPRISLGTSYLVHQEGLKELWLKALNRPDPGLQRMVVDTVAIAHERGVPDLEETTDRMVELLQNPDTRDDLCRAIVQALVNMDAKQHAGPIGEFSKQDGSSVTTLVESALARWKSDVLVDVWLQRVREGTAGSVPTILAIEGLGELQVSEAAEAIEGIVTNPGQPAKLRMVAARTLGGIRNEGTIEIARKILMQSSPFPELPAILAIELLSFNDSDAAIELLTQMLNAERTAVQARALERMYEIDYQLVNEQAEKFVGSSDSNVRRLIAQAMLDSQSVDRIELLANLLDDGVPSLRRLVSAGLIELGQKETLRDEVYAQSMRILNADSWRGCEQACVVLTRLDYKPSGGRMVELLKHPRGEVKVASAWGLSQLRLAEHLPDMVEHANDVYQGFKAGELTLAQREYDEQLAHLFSAFGDQNHQGASEILLKYVPRDDTLGSECRTAACWAIGMINAENPDANILKLLSARIRDVSLLPEREETRQMSAVSVARMKGESELPTLREFANPIGSAGRACQWAIEQLTGEPMEELAETSYTSGSYFLMPIKE